MQTLKMAAELRLPRTMGPEKKREYVERLMNVLGLTKVRGCLNSLAYPVLRLEGRG